jgi:hypothetical protein
MSLIIMAIPLAAAQPPAVALSVPAAPIGARELVPVTVRVADRGEILLDGCLPVELEREVDGRWVVGVGSGCTGAEAPTKIAGQLTVSLPPPGPGTWRAVATWGAGCRSGLPFAFASCSSLGAVRSGPFVIEAELSATSR